MKDVMTITFLELWKVQAEVNISSVVDIEDNALTRRMNDSSQIITQPVEQSLWIKKPTMLEVAI